MTRKVGVVGGGLLGLVLSYRLAQLGHQVELLEAGGELGGLSGFHDYGPFVWDRFYHCILPQDARLISLLGELGLASELRFRQTGTGYYGAGRIYPMSSSWDHLRFPLLSLADKARIGAQILWATRAADPNQLYGISAEEWLVRWCGRRGYDVFWRPLLRAKFGPFHDQIAAVFIWATLTRLFGARGGAAAKEKLGYVRGGYRTILQQFEARLGQLGVRIHKLATVTSIGRSERPGAEACDVVIGRGDMARRVTFDQVFFTGPTGLARQVVAPALLPAVERVEKDYPAAEAYLGVACLVIAHKRSLTPFYVLNVGDAGLDVTGVIEMTNLVDRQTETAGLSLIYVPRYMDANDPWLAETDQVIAEKIVGSGLARIFPQFSRSDVVYQGVHRARHVQPLPLVQSAPPARPEALTLVRPFQILNTAMLRCATLNNDEVVGFVDHFVGSSGVRRDLERFLLAPMPSAAPLSNIDHRVA